MGGRDGDCFVKAPVPSRCSATEPYNHSPSDLCIQMVNSIYLSRVCEDKETNQEKFHHGERSVGTGNGLNLQ